MHQIGWLEAVNINCILNICVFFIATKHLITVVGLNVILLQQIVQWVVW